MNVGAKGRSRGMKQGPYKCIYNYSEHQEKGGGEAMRLYVKRVVFG